MTSPGPTFVVALSRASKQAQRYLHQLPRADREDITAAAVLWCWEHREGFKGGVSLERWFHGAVRDAFKQWARGQRINWENVDAQLGTPDTTLAQVESAELVQHLKRGLGGIERRLAVELLRGATLDELAQRTKMSRSAVKRRLRSLRALRELLPDGAPTPPSAPTPAAPGSDDAADKMAPIDWALQRLEFAPGAGKDCPPCWRCKWFEGFLPNTRRREIENILVEPEVRAAVSAIKARKIDIAQAVRVGTIFSR